MCLCSALRCVSPCQAPEYLAGHTHCAPSMDLYALAITAFYLAVGDVPFKTSVDIGREPSLRCAACCASVLARPPARPPARLLLIVSKSHP